MTGNVIQNSNRRGGFTLVELLIVIAIVGFLMSIIAVATIRLVGNAREAQTKSTLAKVHHQLQTRIKAIAQMKVAGAFADFRNRAFLEAAGVANSASGNRANLVQKILANKVIDRAFLPQNWWEASYLLNRAGQTAPSFTANAPTPEESAEVLYFVLTDGSVPGYTPIDQGMFSTSELKDTNGNGRLEIVDGWGRPLRLIRWPTRLLRPSGLTAVGPVATADYNRAQVLISGLPTTLTSSSSNSQDPDDPANILTPGLGWSNLASAATIEASTTFPMHTLFTWHTPLVLSAGADGDFGIYADSDTAHFGRLGEPDLTNEAALMDDITNLNVKSGGN